MKAFRVLVLVLFCFVTSVYLSPAGIPNSAKANQPKPTPLLDGIMSYQSFERIKTLPKLKKAKWKVLENTRVGLTVETGSYSHLGFTGTATFAFFKRRLIRTWFETSQYVEYRNSLTKKLRLKWDKTGQAVVGKTELNYNWKTVIWTDLDLQQEASVWLGNQSDYNNQHL